MKHILVIEDEQPIRENLEWLLEASGYTVVGASNGREGLERARAEQPDVILCDIMMPEMDGYEVLRILRIDPHLATTPLIFLTARTDRDDIPIGMIAAADDYITKPFAARAVLAAIEARLEQQAREGV